MIHSDEKNQTEGSAGHKRLKPQLKLNTDQNHLEEKKIMIRKNSFNSYVVENHPAATDVSKSASATKNGSLAFFSLSPTPEALFEEYSNKGKYFYINQRSNGKEMQDKCKALPETSEKNIAYFGVFDGHSTQFVAEVAAQKLDQYFVDNYRKEKEITSALKNALWQLEEEMNSYLKQKKLRGGTTALCAVLNKRNIYVANLGDTRATVFQHNSFVHLSNLHDYQNESERKAVEKRGGIILKNRLGGELALSRSIGDVKFKNFMSSEPEIIEYNIKEEDEYLILCTDGVWNGLDSQPMLQKIQEYKEKTAPGEFNLEQLGKSLVDQACENIKTKKDNMSLVIISVKDYLLSDEDVF